MAIEFKVTAVIERLEGDLAILEVHPFGEMTGPKKMFPSDIREGMFFELTFRENPAEEQNRRQSVRDLQRKMMEQSQ